MFISWFLLYIALCFPPIPTTSFFFFKTCHDILFNSLHNQNSLWSKSSVSKAGMLTRVFYSSLLSYLKVRRYLSCSLPHYFFMDWVFVSSKIHVLNPNPQWDSIGGGIMGKWLGHEGGAHISDIMPLQKRPQRVLVLLSIWGYIEKMAIYEPGNGPSPDI